MEISITELQTILNRIISKREQLQSSLKMTGSNCESVDLCYIS